MKHVNNHIIPKLPLWGLGGFLLLTLASCHTKRSVTVSSVSTANAIDVTYHHLDSMFTQRLFTFDELVWLETLPTPSADGGDLVTDSGCTDLSSLTAGRVRVGIIKGGRVESESNKRSETSADYQSAEVREYYSQASTECKPESYVRFNYVITGLLLVFLILLFIRIRSPSG